MCGILKQNVGRVKTFSCCPKTIAESPKTISGRPKSIVARFQTIAADTQTIAAKLQTIAAKLQTIVAKLQTIAAKLQTIAAELQTIVAKLQTIVAKLQTTVAKLQTTVSDRPQRPFNYPKTRRNPINIGLSRIFTEFQQPQTKKSGEASTFIFPNSGHLSLFRLWETFLSKPNPNLNTNHS